MKILLRNDYRWVDAGFDRNNRVIVAEGRDYDDTNIVAIQDDERAKFLTCAKCGAIIPNTPEEIEKHIHLIDSFDTCLNCGHHYEETVELVNRVMNPMENGNFSVNTTKEIKLLCNKQYLRFPVSDVTKKSSCCKYAHCTRDTLESYNSIFIKYPKCFEQMYTIDALDLASWKYSYKYGPFYKYELNHRTHLNVYLTQHGIIDHFEYVCRNNHVLCFYSKEFDKLFWGDGGYYSEHKIWPVTDWVENFILKECRKIYKGE